MAGAGSPTHLSRNGNEAEESPLKTNTGNEETESVQKIKVDNEASAEFLSMQSSGQEFYQLKKQQPEKTLV